MDGSGEQGLWGAAVVSVLTLEARERPSPLRPQACAPVHCTLGRCAMEGEGSGLAEGGLGCRGGAESPGSGTADRAGIPPWLLSSCGAPGEPQNSPFLGRGVGSGVARSLLEGAVGTEGQRVSLIAGGTAPARSAPRLGAQAPVPHTSPALVPQA